MGTARRCGGNNYKVVTKTGNVLCYCDTFDQAVAKVQMSLLGDLRIIEND